MTSVASRSPDSTTLRGIARVQLIVGTVSVAVLIAMSVWGRFALPYRDDWDWLLHMFEGPSGLRGLLQPHNEHVIPLARLIFSLQYHWQGLTGGLMSMVALACQLLVVWLFWSEIGRQWPTRPSWRAYVGGTAMIGLCFTQQLQSIVFAAATLFPMVQVWVTLALVAMLQATESGGTDRRRRWWWTVTGLCTIGAAASTTSGLVTPVVLALLAWLRGAHRRVLLTFGALAVVWSGVYLWWVVLGGADASGQGQVAPLGLPGFWPLVTYGAAVLASGLSYVDRSVAVGVGLIVAGWTATCGWLAWRDPRRVTRLEAFALGQMIFGVASVLMVTPGRAQFGVMQAGQSRYATFVLCLLVGVVVFTASRLDRAALGRRWRLGLALAGCVLAVMSVVPDLYVGLLWRAKADLLAAAYSSIRSGAPDPDALVSLHPTPVVIRRVLAHVRATGGEVLDSRMGTRLDGRLPTASCGAGGATEAGILERRGPDGSLRLTGHRPQGFTSGVIVDGAGVVVGLTRPSPWVTESAPSPLAVHRVVRDRVLGHPGDARAWIGFAQQGVGPPYRWVLASSPGTWSCADLLEVRPVVRLSLDVVRRVDATHVLAEGWAFACGESMATWQVVVDGEVRSTSPAVPVRRPDVASAMASACGVTPESGAQVTVDAAALLPGRHTAVLRVTTSTGFEQDSAPRSFEWERR